MADSDEDLNPEEVDEALRDTYEGLLNVNQKIILKTRRQAQRIEQLIELYAQQIGRLEELQKLHLQGAMSLSQIIGDIIATEWDLQGDDDEKEDEEPDEE